MGKIIGVFSGKGGVGKTTLVANLGALLANVHHKNVLIVDLNVYTAHLGLHYGVYENMPVTLREVLSGKVPVSYATYIHPSTGVRILLAPLNADDVAISQEKLDGIMNELRDNYDWIIIDSAPGLGKEALITMSLIDDALLVTTPDLPSVTDVIKSKNLLDRLQKNVVGLVVNRYNSKK